MIKSKTFQKVPTHILAQIKQFAAKEYVICSKVKIKYGETLPNVPGLVANDIPIAAGESLPDPAVGTWARRNVEGWNIVRKDWPKVTKTFTHESPNFGDWYNGSHEVSVDRDVYQREFFPPHGSTISYQEISRDEDSVIVYLELTRIFKGLPDDERELLFALNVFTESVGFCSVRTTDRPVHDYTDSLHIDWEILPIGDREATLRTVKGKLSPNSQEERVIEDRLGLLLSMNPSHLLTGKSGFARYVGAQYADNLVAFENVRYGNALYVMFDDWQRLSKMSRLELIASEENFERIIHTTSWKQQAKAIIESKLQKQMWRL
jgi:hypothetical protein